MNDFKGLSRDTSIVKTPEQMWQFARNILLTRKYLSVSNEKGNEYGYSIPGVVIGYVASNEDLVYISLDGDYTCIGYVNYLKGVYEPVLRTNNPNFKFNLNSPIEGVYVYNYKKEMVIVFSDGINSNSNTPKLINIHNPQVKLSPTKDFLAADDYVMFELFNHTELPTVDIAYESGALNAEVVHIAFCYVFEDNTQSLFSPVIETAYPNYKNNNKAKRNVKIKLSNLSNKFNKIKLAFVVKKEGGTFGYTTAVLNVSLEGTLEYTLSSEEDLTIATPEEIVIESSRFTKIRSITKTANQIEIANVEQKPIEDFQKYANMLTLNLKIVNDKESIEKYKTHPTLLPDEVYSVNIVPIYKDGTKGGAFHIPGRQAIGAENAPMLNGELDSIGLNFPKFKDKGYKKFHFLNTGSVSSTGDAFFGYWENENKYPYKDRYNSTDVGGVDLRDTPVRYHKIPSQEVFPDTINGNPSNHKITILGTVPENLGEVPRFIVEVANFDAVFPSHIKDNLQGYELLLEKRSRGGSYIDTTGVLYVGVVPQGTSISMPGTSYDTATPNMNFKDFSIASYLSPETITDKIAINASFVKVLYGIRQGQPIIDGIQRVGTTNTNVVPTLVNKYANIKEAKYALANNISSSNRFLPERLQLTLEHKVTGTATKYEPIIAGNKDINFLAASLITLNKNIYNLENNNDFISLGVYLLDKTNIPNYSGDVFVTNEVRVMTVIKWERSGTVEQATGYQDYYINNMYSPLSNHAIKNGVGSVFGKGALYTSVSTTDVNMLNSADYTTSVKNSTVDSYFNDFVPALPPALTENFINYFPYRVYKGLAIPNESLQTKNLRTFPVNSYYDMRNDRGEIIAIRGDNTSLFIQQRYSLFKTSIKDKLNSTVEETYLGSSELFDRIPEEIVYNGNIGYIGSNSQFGCIMTKDGYCTIDEEKGKVFIISDSLAEISQQNMKITMAQVLPLGNKFIKKDLLDKPVKVDNPYNSVGYIIGVDEENNRLLLTKKFFEPTELAKELTFDGEFYTDTDEKIVPYTDGNYFIDKSFTLSYALDSKTWVCFHDYAPNVYFNTSRGLYGVLNSIDEDSVVYKFNSDTTNPGNFFGIQYESYVDLIHNTRLDINKQYQAIYWVSESIEMGTDRVIQFETIDEVMVYNNHQCSGIIPVSKTDLKTARNVEGIWQLNEFRDMMVSPANKFLDADGNLIPDTLAAKKLWFTKGLFIGNFIVTRFVWKNEKQVVTHIHNVNVKSITSNR